MGDFALGVEPVVPCIIVASRHAENALRTKTPPFERHLALATDTRSTISKSDRLWKGEGALLWLEQRSAAIEHVERFLHVSIAAIRIMQAEDFVTGPQTGLLRRAARQHVADDDALAVVGHFQAEAISLRP